MNGRGVKTLDFLWNGESWELKTLSTFSANGINDNIKKAIKQIESYKSAGGIIVDITSVKLNKYNIFKKISD